MVSKLHELMIALSKQGASIEITTSMGHGGRPFVRCELRAPGMHHLGKSGEIAYEGLDEMTCLELAAKDWLVHLGKQHSESSARIDHVQEALRLARRIEPSA